MKKKILCLILVTLMIIGSLPLSVLASGIEELSQAISSMSTDTGSGSNEKEQLPVVHVSSPYFFEYDGRPEEFRFVPDYDGNFLIDITLDKTPKVDEEILVYYRTQDDSAVSEWGDYEGVSGYESAYVTLNKANGYKARVVIKSLILDEGYGVYDSQHKTIMMDRIVTRRFRFTLMRVEGKALLPDEDPSGANDNNRNENFCYLRANRYHVQDEFAHGTIYGLGNMLVKTPINTPVISKSGSYSDSLNISFSEYRRNAVSAGLADVYVALNGSCKEDWWNSDGPATLHLYYTYQGKKYRALSLYIEGEFDDSTYYGWQHAFDYMNDRFTSDKYYGADVEDFMKDNFRGFTLYNNDGSKAFEVIMGKDRSSSDIIKVCEALKRACNEGYAVYNETGREYGVTRYWDIVHLKLPSNYVLADSYSYEFISEAEKDRQKRWLENVYVDFCFSDNLFPEIVEDEKGIQMVTTNIEEMQVGDPIRVMIRFDRPVGNLQANLKLKINGTYSVSLKNIQLWGKVFNSLTGGYVNQDTFCWDTLVFEGYLPEGIQDIKITSITDFEMTDPWSIRSVATYRSLQNSHIDSMYGLNKDLRAPVATVNATTTQSWEKSKPIEVNLHVENRKSVRFNDYATLYYQWSNSPELPESYSSKIVFHTDEDGEVLKTIFGTGNGATYLHLKTVSGYGRTTISDMKTSVYDPTDENATYTPFGPYLFDNMPPQMTEGYTDLGGDLKNRELTVEIPDDDSGVQYMYLYYIPHGSTTGEGVLLKNKVFEITSTNNDQPLSFTINHKDVGVGVDENDNLVLDRKEIDFYWILSDKLGNTSQKTGKFSLVFDTNDYLDSTIVVGSPHKQFINRCNPLGTDALSYTFDYSVDETGKAPISTSGDAYFGFSFMVDLSKLETETKVESETGSETETGTTQEEGNAANETTYTITVKYRGNAFDNTKYNCTEIDSDGLITVWFTSPMSSGRYEFQLVRKEGDSTRVSMIYTVYVTDGFNDPTETKEKIEAGTLLHNSVYQLTTQFYYKSGKDIVKVPYNGVGTSQPATFSSYSKAKEYAYYRELGDIYLVKITSTIADALNSNTNSEYMKAAGETATAQMDQYWIRYKSKSWEPGASDSAWVYYYYGKSDLSESALPLNLKQALDTISNRITSLGKAVILTDTSLFLGSSMGDKMLDEYGMPYLLDAQIHYDGETSENTLHGNKWSLPVSYSGDKNIYNSNVGFGNPESSNYAEYPIVGNFPLETNSTFQYMTHDKYGMENEEWIDIDFEYGDSFIKIFNNSGIYYIREFSNDGVAVYPIYIDKESPKVSFLHKDDKGNLTEIPVDGIDVVDITTKDLIIGKISDLESDRMSYVAVYNVSNLNLVGIYTADDLDNSTIKLPDGNYYLVVADRSGNHYTITAKISNSTLDCQIKESPDKFIKITCNRSEKQILKYEIYRNGELVTSKYEAEQSFDKAGLYTIYIQDIYGNVFSEEHDFKRNYPAVTWKYLGADGKYHEYDPESSDISGFVLTQVSDNDYKISTAVKTRFTFTENYGFEFVGSAPEHTVTTGAETTVTIEAGQSFTLKVFYKNHKNCYTTYTGVVDVTPPSINVSADVDVLINGEYDLFNSWIEKGSVSMDKIFYKLSEIAERTVANGSVISSDIIKINTSDANNLSLVEVYLDGQLIKKQDIDSGFSQIVVSKWGDYRIVSKDTLGNIAEFSFTNGMPDGLDYFVDGVKNELDLHGYLNFNEDNVYTKVDYGNTAFRLDIKENADIFISVCVSNGKTEIYGFRIEDGKIYPLTYKIGLDKNNKKAVEISLGDIILDLNSKNFKTDSEYQINKNGAHPLYATIDKNMVVSIRAYAPKDPQNILSINARIGFTEGNTLFVSSEISKKSSDVYFKETGVQTNTSIRLNDGFTIDESVFESERIKSISLYYSKVNDLDPANLRDRVNVYSANKQYNDEGFYLLVARNLYGNEKIYRITVSKSFSITSSITFGDGHKIYYSKDYNNVLYSNNTITLDILDEDVTVAVTLNGSAYTGFTQNKESGITYLVFTQEGRYKVKLTDSYGNVITRELEINKSTCTVKDELLTGYNEKALKREEGYTNQKLSIDKKVYDESKIYYLAIKYGETLTVLFDDFAEKPISTDAQGLVDVIGTQGDGVYTVICRNRYGAVVTKDIHYRGTPTLKLERTTRSKAESEIYDLNYAISLGFWSNNTLTFSTEANTYLFKINASVSECPRTLVFENAGDYGSFEYDVYYIDEYGFEYIFKAYLVRKDIEINIPSSIEGVEINGILNTKDDISITFGDGIYATYTRNNGEEVIYHSGDILKKDGTYKFTVLDYAGNATTITLKKDTVVEFEFVETVSGTVIQNGSVVNSTKVDFNALNKDSAYIEKVLLNGVAQTDFTGSKFTKDGKWEIILCDSLGNRAYFSFFIITRSQNGFAYTTPYEYRITEMWYDNGDGIKVSYLNFVNHDDFSSSFNFTENGHYTVVMTSLVTGNASTFEFNIDTNAPNVSLVGCNPGETTLNDISITGCKVGDRIRIYKMTDTGEELVTEIEITSNATKMPTITEGGKYRIVVESEAGVVTELTFVRKHVMNTAGSVFIMIIIGLAVIGLFTGLVYRNKSKTDD